MDDITLTVPLSDTVEWEESHGRGSKGHPEVSNLQYPATTA